MVKSSQNSKTHKRNHIHDYIPQKGDLVYLNFNPQTGHEQAGLRPALIVSPARYNAKLGLALVCPITSKSKGLPFEVPLTRSPAEADIPKITGVILADQLKSIDWRARKATFIARINDAQMEEVLEKILPLLLEV